MKILYDNIIFSLQNSGGISVMWAELIKRALASTSDISFIEYENAADNLFRGTLHLPSNALTTFSKKGLAFNRYFSPKVKLSGSVIFHSSYYRIIKQPGVINVTTVHDFIYDFFRRGPAKFVNVYQQGQALQNSDLIICVSQSTKKDLLQLYPHISQNKIKVIYHGVSNEFYEMQTEATTIPAWPFAEKQYVIYVGDRHAVYKNFAQLVKAFPPKINLVIVGGGPPQEKELALLNKHIGPGRYKFMGYVANSFLNMLYNNALALVYPSLYEGFGMPVLEAQKAGCPVIALNRSSIPEVAGGGAILLDGLSVASMANAIESLADETVRRWLVCEGFKNVQRFSWDATFNQTVEAYREVWKNKFGE